MDLELEFDGQGLQCFSPGEPPLYISPYLSWLFDLPLSPPTDQTVAAPLPWLRRRPALRHILRPMNTTAVCPTHPDIRTATGNRPTIGQ